MHRVLEISFRHRIQLAVMTVAPILIALVIALAQPRMYEANATLWALQRYAVIGASGVEADLTSTPATTQADALTELLQTHSFSLAIAKETDLASTMSAATRSNPYTLNDALYNEISKNVKVTASDANLYEITYDNKNPKIAQQVVAAVVDRFGAEATQFSVIEGKQLLATYVSQLTQAQSTAAASADAASKYIKEHPNATAQSDPVYSQLLNQSQADQTNVVNLQASIAQLNQQLAKVGDGSGGLYAIIDQATVDNRPISRVKTLALAGGIALAVALLSCTIYLIMLLRQDRTMYVPSDVRRMVDVPMLLELPFLPATMHPKTGEASHTLQKRAPDTATPR